MFCININSQVPVVKLSSWIIFYFKTDLWFLEESKASVISRLHIWRTTINTNYYFYIFSINFQYIFFYVVKNFML